MSKITVPDLGDFHDVEVIDVLVKPGDKIDVDTPLLTIETEKATMDVPSTTAGVVKAVALKKGDRVSKGTEIATLEEGGSDQGVGGSQKKEADSKQEGGSDQGVGGSQKKEADSKQEAGSDQGVGGSQKKEADSKQAAGAGKEAAAQGADESGVTSQQSRSSVLPSINEVGFSRAYAGPSVRRFAREMGVDLTRVQGTGLKSRITADDVKAWVKQALSSGASAGGGSALPKIPEIDFAKFGAVEVKPLGRIQKISGGRLHASWVNVPHVWQMDEADITDLEATRSKLKDEAAKQGIKLTPLAFILRACVKALQEFPNFNASLDSSGQNLVLKKYVHLGFAADTPNGLVVPVIRDADRKDIYDLARALAALSEKARDGKLSAAEMQGGSFTVSSLGGIGGTAFTPIINAPEVAILGVSRSSMKPVFQKDAFVPRLTLPFTLAYDHRVIDGATGVRFTTYLAQRLADVRGLLEAVP